MILVFNEEPVREEETSYYKVVERGGELIVYQIIIAYYRHPEALESAIIPVFEERIVKTLQWGQKGYAAADLLRLVTKNTKEVFKS